MSIDPRILAKLKSGPPTANVPDADDRPVQEELFDQSPFVTRGLPVLVGTFKQIRWAVTIRDDMLALRWPEAEKAKLTKVTDASWWIANRTAVNSMKYKEPAPHQLQGYVESEAKETVTPFKPDAQISKAVETFRRQLAEEEAEDTEDEDDPTPDTRARGSVDTRSNDAMKWAESVSKHPMLAEAAILAVLSRLYKGPIRDRLKARAHTVLNNAQEAVERDADAIFQMLEKP
jgi:hypothetical protein